jgi:hypothetical protein
MGEGRIHAADYPADWERYTFVETVHEPRRVSARRLDEMVHEVRMAAAGRSWVWKRTLRTLWMTRSVTTAAFVHGMNAGWARMARLQVAGDAGQFVGVAPSAERAKKIRRAFALRCGT